VKSGEREKHGFRRKLKAWESSYSRCPLAGGTPSKVWAPAHTGEAGIAGTAQPFSSLPVGASGAPTPPVWWDS